MAKKHIIIGLAIFSLIASCKDKKVEIDSCNNGYLDAGETQIDCGGTCKPCSQAQLSYSYLKLNANELSFSSKKITKDSTFYFLSIENDTLEFNINLGPNISKSLNNINAYKTYGRFKTTYYSNLSNGIVTITKVDTINKLVSGYFDLDLSRTNNIDTMHIRSGSFSNYSY